MPYDALVKLFKSSITIHQSHFPLQKGKANRAAESAPPRSGRLVQPITDNRTAASLYYS